jgi:sugar phosphate permease
MSFPLARENSPEDLKKTSSAQRDDGGPQATRGAWLMTIVVMLAVMVATFDRINIAVLFTNKSFHEAIGVGNNPALMGLLMSGFVFAYGISMLLFSISGDVFGPRKSLAGITAILAVVMTFMGLASSYTAMLVSRVLLGAAEGPQYGSGNAAVKRWFPSHRHSFANAIWVSGGPLSMAIGFPLVISIVAYFGWRVSFFTLAAFDALLILPILWILKDRASMTDGSDGDIKREELRVPLFTALGTFMRDWKFWMIFLFDCGVVTFLFGFITWLPSYLEQVRHFNVLRTGFFSALPFIFEIVGCLGGAWLADRFQRRALVCFVGMILASACVYSATIVPDAVAAGSLLGLSGMFFGATVPTMFSIGQAVVPARVTAAGLGVYGGLASLSAGTIAPVAMGAIIGTSGYAAALTAMAVVCTVFALSMVPLIKRY